MRVTLVAALAENRVIGRDGGLPWHLPGDLKRFKALTLGHPVILGRRTHESIGRPLPGRTHVVVSRDPGFRARGAAEGFVAVTSLEEALEVAERAPGSDEVFVIGGAALYAAALPRAERMVLTFVEGSFEGDVLFPSYDAAQWREVTSESHAADAKNPHAFRVCDLRRRGPAE